MNPSFIRLLENESSFDRLFCDVVTTDSFSIYYNSYFSDDPIFNHAEFSNWLLTTKNYSPDGIEKAFTKINSKTKELGVPAALYVERFWDNARKIEQDAIEFGFMITELMHIMTKPTNNLQASQELEVRSYETKDIDQWNAAFVKSFQIPEVWIPELKRRLERLVSDRNTGLMVAKEDTMIEASGCLLFKIEPADCLGIYCVGTIPERRSHGVAKAMMAEVEKIAAQRGCDTMVLQTLERDGVTPMYLKLGFETAFERDVLQLGS